MGLSQSTKNKFKTGLHKFTLNSKKCFQSLKKTIKNRFNICYISCCIPTLYKNNRNDSEEIVNSNIELKEIKSDKQDIKLINCKLDKKTPSLNNYVNDSYIRSKSDSSVSTKSKENNITLDLHEPV